MTPSKHEKRRRRSIGHFPVDRFLLQNDLSKPQPGATFRVLQ